MRLAPDIYEQIYYKYNIKENLNGSGIMVEFIRANLQVCSPNLRYRGYVHWWKRAFAAGLFKASESARYKTKTWTFESSETALAKLFPFASFCFHLEIKKRRDLTDLQLDSVPWTCPYVVGIVFPREDGDRSRPEADDQQMLAGLPYCKHITTWLRWFKM